ncbi:MAG: integrase core domain-containing protein, partial [Candidatus Acetothermia bacterium]|nr:integrase core domain-containing protein [Candidatus Acetothermia bacterium]
LVAHAVQVWLEENHCRTIYIEPGSPWENPYIEGFHGTLRRECLDRYAFESVQEAQEIVAAWREEYNEDRPHSALGYLTPAEFAQQCRLEADQDEPEGTRGRSLARARGGTSNGGTSRSKSLPRPAFPEACEPNTYTARTCGYRLNTSIRPCMVRIRPVPSCLPKPL